MIIGIDMDGCVANFSKGINDEYRKLHNKELELNPEHSNFYIEEDVIHKEDEQRVINIYNTSGFFYNLEPIIGAKECIERMDKLEGVNIFFVTSPMLTNKSCLKDKESWIRNYMGTQFVKKYIPIRDKTLIKCDFLIDDKPEIKGLCKPEFEHIYFTQPWNKNYKGRRINSWNYKEVYNILGLR